jgi:hypothetical protein
VSKRTATVILAALAVVAIGAVAALSVSNPHPASSVREGPWGLPGSLLVANLRVAQCQTSFGAPDGSSDELPTHQLAVVPTRLWRGLAMYTDGLGTLDVVGPSSWQCTALDAVDGSSILVIHPPGAPTPGWGDVTAVRLGIVASQTGGCSGCSLETACPLFRAASLRYAATYRLPCRHAARGEELLMTAAPSKVLFIDPPGVLGAGRPSGGANAAYGAMLWHVPGDPRATAWLDTCTLPSSDRELCVASVDAFLARHPVGARPRATRRPR